MKIGTLFQDNDFDWVLLKSVSRSFYLSLRYLPKKIQQPLCLTYLLARLTDNVSDNIKITPERRHMLLLLCHDVFCTPAKASQATLLNNYLLEDIHYFSNADIVLIKSLPVLIEKYHQQIEFDKSCIQQVLRAIFAGQLFDISQLDAQKGRIETALALEEYLYLVAGSVGEFWTKLCCHHLKDYLPEPIDDYVLKAIHFGKALQLTNMLRDLPQDIEQGRFYFPLQSITDPWHEKALIYLQDAHSYIKAIRHPRVQFACFVPYFLAKKTLCHLQKASYYPAHKKVKISRSHVYFSLCKAAYQAYVIGNLR